ncbi:MAG: V-type ATP synthase subunit I [Candidatus Schekmanbacteria bacterium]|nr:V-type ATP synthase subunit I [Candidatus Schekmanbacteria bacterium]
MAIEKFKKIQILAHASRREALLDELQQISGVQILNWRESSLAEEEQSAQEISTSTHEIDARLNKAEYCLKYIQPFIPPLSLKEKLAKITPKVTLEQLKQLAESFSLEQIYEHCQLMEQQISEAHLQLQQLQTQIQDLQPWINLNVTLDTLQKTETVYFYPLRIPADSREEFPQVLASHLNHRNHLIEVGIGDDSHYLIVIILHEDKPLLEGMLTEKAIERIHLPALPDIPQNIIQKSQNEIEQIQNKLQRIQEEKKQLVRHKESLELLYDYYFNLKKQMSVQSDLLHTHHALIFEGWIKQSRADETKRHLENKFKEIVVNLRDTMTGEAPPVDLYNKNIVKPFEVITKLYGLPHADELDPTPLLAPFFFIFFGLCMADVGYGFILVAGALWALYSLILRNQTRQTMRLILFIGISTILAGAITGGWFGDMIDLLPAAFAPLKAMKNQLMLFDPIKEPFKFIIVALTLGFIQVWFGVLVEMYDNIKHKNWESAYLLKLPWLALLLGLVIYIIEITQNLSGAVTLVRQIMVYGGTVVLLFLSQVQEKGIFGRIFKGFLELYTIIGYASDILSYSRLMVLGLAGGVIAMVVNQMAMLTTGIPVVGYVLMVLIMIGGHIFNFAIGILGAFVHSVRLQFVEFFPKFFEGGGKSFQPFAWEGKYSIFSGK